MSKSKAELEHLREIRNQVKNRKKTVRKYGLTPDDVEAMEQRQRNRCAICFELPREGLRLHVDHAHDTGMWTPAPQEATVIEEGCDPRCQGGWCFHD